MDLGWDSGFSYSGAGVAARVRARWLQWLQCRRKCLAGPDETGHM